MAYGLFQYTKHTTMKHTTNKAAKTHKENHAATPVTDAAITYTNGIPPQAINDPKDVADKITRLSKTGDPFEFMPDDGETVYNLLDPEIFTIHRGDVVRITRL